jgi:hypothetical protein
VQTYSHAGPFLPEPDRACFVPLGLRNPALPLARARVAAFGLTKGGCPISGAVLMQPPIAVAGAGAVCILFPAPVSSEGYFVETGVGGDGDDADPVQWAVKVANGGGGGDSEARDSTGADGASEKSATKWQKVGASAWELWYTGELHLYSALSYPTPRGGAVRLEVTAAPGWEWCIGWPVSQAVQLLCFAALGVAGAIGRESLAPGLLAGGYGLLVALNATAAAGLLASDRLREAAQYWLSLVPAAVLSVGAALAGKHILSVLAAVAVLYFIVQVCDHQSGEVR